MAHFAQLNEENLVTQVIVVANQDTADQDGVENEAIGIAFCQGLLGGNWKQTSYNHNMRVRYAGIGYSYNAELDAFVPPKPYASWILNSETASWDAPKPMPSDQGTGDPIKHYYWNEEAQEWELPSA